MLRLPDSWVWDFWIVDDGAQYHAFFLFASRALHDPEARHDRASIGHAVSDDLVNWTRVADALVRSDGPAWDDLATWTGSVVRDDDGTWCMFYTGAALTPAGNVQRIGLATSPDLITWTKRPGPLAAPDPRWYELLDGTWTDEAFRDPWVFRDPDGNGWHMLITARANHGELRERGVIGHATSEDLRSWTVRPPLTEPRHGFAQFEVPQYVEVDGQGVLIVNCGRPELAEWRRALHPEGGAIWAVPADGPLGPYDFDRAQPLADRELYVGKVVAVRGTDRHVLLAFRNLDAHGRFVGEIIDPRPVGLREGRLVSLDDQPAVSVA